MFAETFEYVICDVRTFGNEVEFVMTILLPEYNIMVINTCHA